MVKQEMLAVRGGISLKGEAVRAWAAVLSWQLPRLLLRDWEERQTSCTAANGGAVDMQQQWMERTHTHSQPPVNFM